MAKVETFDTSINPLEVKEIAMLLADSVEEMAKIGQNLYIGVADDRVSSLLKVARSKVATLQTEMLAMLDMIEEMGKREEYLAGADADDIKNEVDRRTDIFSENEI